MRLARGMWGKKGMLFPLLAVHMDLCAALAGPQRASISFAVRLPPLSQVKRTHNRPLPFGAVRRAKQLHNEGVISIRW